MSITIRQRNIILGLMLGDGHLEKNGRFARLRIDQSLKHRDYINWLYQELSDIVPSKPRIIQEKDRRTLKVYTRLHFSTYSNGQLDKWRCVFYVNNRKIVLSGIVNMLNHEISLAVWFMDDGYKRNDCAAVRLNTDAFTYSEQKLLIRCLEKNFKIKSRIHKKGRWFNIYIPKDEARKFCRLVKPYILPSFRYKLL
jgi:hypothetical protein